jgi:hypothetical protein
VKKSSRIREIGLNPYPSWVLVVVARANITILDNSHLDAQVKITYDEVQLHAAGVSEFALRMYYLDQSDIWQLCPIQGVDTVNNCVWSNTTLTGKSYFVVGGRRGIAGDINGDSIVDIFDAILLANAYNSHMGSPTWNPNADINADTVVDIFDAIILANHYNQHYP